VGPGSEPRRGLVIGYGNPGRGDDGLGVRLAERLEAEAPPGVDVEAAFQPGIEHAAGVAEHDWVLFLDAAADARPPCELRRVDPRPDLRLGSHEVDLGAILAIAAESFGRRTPAWLLAVRGYAFDMAEELSEAAAGNLEAALARARRVIGRLQRCEGDRYGDDGESGNPDHR
jgi:hydrogenase maturation protease